MTRVEMEGFLKETGAEIKDLTAMALDYSHNIALCFGSTTLIIHSESEKAEAQKPLQDCSDTCIF